MTTTTPRPARFARLAETGRRVVAFTIDGVPATALEGDTVLVALLTSGRRVRDSEFGDATRAGFCLMGACQDCWVRDGSGAKIRSCSTPVTDGMAIQTTAPEAAWLRRT